MKEVVPVKPKAATAPDDAPSEFQDTLGIPVAQAMSTDIATWLGGIVALINMLQHLGLPECDAQSDTEWTVEILQRFCQRLAPEDALLPNLPQRALRHPETVSTFVPQLQHAAVGRPFELCRISDAPGHRALMWPGGRGVVACLDASALRRLRAKNVPMTHRHKQIVTNDLPDLMQTGLCLLVQRTLRVFLERPWRHCLRRPACAVTTETHLDVTLDLDDVRLPERRVGLDRSPGWVPWLGRVVTLHFERFDKPGGPHE